MSPKSKPRFAIILVTAPGRRIARRLATAALEARLIACANLLPQIESHYWWQGKIETGKEVLMILKTTSARVPALQRLIIAKHPYDTPEFIVLPITSGNKRYLDWIVQSVS
jgi:periplasmic divalent cation tolerance protein